MLSGSWPCSSAAGQVLADTDAFLLTMRVTPSYLLTGAFDYCGSHCVWHLAVVAAVVLMDQACQQLTLTLTPTLTLTRTRTRTLTSSTRRASRSLADRGTVATVRCLVDVGSYIYEGTLGYGFMYRTVPAQCSSPCGAGPPAQQVGWRTRTRTRCPGRSHARAKSYGMRPGGTLVKKYF